MTPTTIYQGTRAPVTFTLTVQAGDSGRDLSTVSAASFSVRFPNRSTTTWTASLGTQTATTLVLSHTFDTSGVETATAGDYSMSGSSTVTGIGAATATGAGTSAGTSTAAGIGSAYATGTGTAAGTSTCTGIGSWTVHDSAADLVVEIDAYPGCMVEMDPDPGLVVEASPDVCVMVSL